MLKPRNSASCFAGSDSKTLIISITATTVLLAVSVLLLSLTGHSLQRVQLVASLRSECAGLEASDPLVVWDAAAAKCSPDVCGDAWLPEIADLDGQVPASLLCGLRLFDTAAARACLRGKRLVLLGDSTMAETAHDLAILLSGIATDSGRLHEHVNAATRVPAEAGMQRMQMPALGGRGGDDLEGPVDITFRSTHRDMEIGLASLNISIVTRYIGHHDIGGAGGGITSIRHPTLAPVVQCLLGESDTPLGASSDTSSGSSTASNSTGSGAAALSCPPPDVVVVNSGMHDAYGGRDVEPKFQAEVQQLAARLAALTTDPLRRMRAFWLGSKCFQTFPEATFHLEVMGLDSMARFYFEKEGLPYIDLAGLMRTFLPPGTDARETYTTDYLHWGSIAYFHNANISMAASSLMTQRMLGAICEFAFED